VSDNRVSPSAADVRGVVRQLREAFGATEQEALDAIAVMDLQPKWPCFVERGDE
jgi:hypothetical protein